MSRSTRLSFPGDFALMIQSLASKRQGKHDWKVDVRSTARGVWRNMAKSEFPSLHNPGWVPGEKGECEGSLESPRRR